MSRAVLIVEDTESCSSTLAIALSGFMNLSVEAARNGAEAWSHLQTDSAGDICAVITDLHMPVLDGYSLIERIRANPVHSRIPVLVLSGSTDPQAPERAIELGADAFFAKPYSPARVRDKLKQLLYEKNLPPA